MIDSMFQEGTDTALDDQVRRPATLKPPESGFWKGAGQVAAAPFQGLASGATKTAAFGAEISGAFGSVMGATDGFGGGMFSTGTPEERKQQEEARQRLRNEGLQFSNAPADTLRERARQVMPDPNSTNAAAQVIAGVAEFATQAVGYAALGGTVAGPAMLAGDAAFSEADKLKQQGVDLRTRQAAGVVAGAVAGLSVALPVAGKTVAGTVGLVAAGGPGGFIAQQAAEKAILQQGGYAQIADTYDPFDPTALALATLVPAAFGAAALRGGRGVRSENQILAPLVQLNPTEQARSDAFERSDSNLAELRKAIKDEKRPEIKTELQAELARQTENQRKYGQAVAAEPDSVPAARVQQTAAQVDSYRLTHDSDMAGRTAHQDAMETAHEQLARGDRVDVSDIVKMPEPAYASRVVDEAGNLQRVFHGTGDAFDEYGFESDVQGMRNILRGTPAEGKYDGRFFFTDAPTVASEYATGARVNSEGANIRPAHLDMRDPLEIDAKGARGKEKFALVEQAIGDAIDAGKDGVILRNVFDHIADNPDTQTKPHSVFIAFRRDQIRSTFDPLPSFGKAVEELQSLRMPAEPPRARRDAATPAAEAATLPTTARQPQAVDVAGNPPGQSGENMGLPAGQQAAQNNALSARAAEASTQQPDLMVQLEGREPMKASELLETVRREAEEEAKDAGLVDVAANCFLRAG